MMLGRLEKMKSQLNIVQKIKVIGTNENSKHFPIFTYCSSLVKITLNAGYEVSITIFWFGLLMIGLQQQAFENNGAIK